MAPNTDKSDKEKGKDKEQVEIEKKDTDKPKSGKGKDKEKESTAAPPPQDLTYAELLRVSFDLVHTAANQNDSKPISRMIRHFTLLRRKVKVATLIKSINRIMAGSPLQQELINSIKLCIPPKSESAKESEANGCSEADADVPMVSSDSADSKDKDKTDKDDKTASDKEKEAKKEKGIAIPEHNYSSSSAEQEVLLVLLSVVYLLDRGLDSSKMIEIAEAVMERVWSLNKRYTEQLVAKVYFYCATAYELGGRLRELRFPMLKWYRTAVIHRDLMLQATLLNLILRELMLAEDHDVAMRMVPKATYPETLRSNTQYARYLYYIGRLQAISLEYSEAHSKLMQSIRKAPQGQTAGKGFRIAAYKLAIVVELLMGDIPERQIFDEQGMRVALTPYRAVVLAVRGGDLAAFKTVTEKHHASFKRDGTLFLIHRLHHNVIRAGLRIINLSYSKISLNDIALKLGLGPNAAHDAEGIVSKAILDGVMEAVIHHDQQAVISKSTTDVYTSSEPTKALHKRIAYCLHLHDDAVKAMQYVDDEQNKADDGEARRKEHNREMLRVEEGDSDDELDGEFGL